MSVVNQWNEEDYFTSICIYLASVVGIDEDNVENTAHRIMDVWTFDGVLDTDSLDKIMSEWK